MAVLLCTHNGERFLPLQLDSLMAQTRLPSLVVVHDWGSTDSTRAILGRRAGDCGHSVQWEVFTHAHAPGPARSFLHALGDLLDRRSDFDYVFYCDQDDVWHPRKLETFADIILGTPAPPDLLYCDVALSDESGRILEPHYLGEGGVFGRPMDIGHRSTLFVSTVSGMSMAVSRAFLVRHRDAWNLTDWVMHDWAVSIVAHLTAARVVFIPRSLVQYRQHDANSVGGTGIATKRRSWLAALQRGRRYVRQVHAQYEACSSRLPASLSAGLKRPIGRWEVARTVLAGRSLGRFQTLKVALGYALLWPSHR